MGLDVRAARDVGYVDAQGVARDVAQDVGPGVAEPVSKGAAQDVALNV